MSLNFHDPMNEQASAFIKKLFEPTAMDEQQVLLNDLTDKVDQANMKELANLAKQPVTLEINELGEIKEMSDGTKYRLTLQGWRKLENKS
jgi:hypothetical protein